MNTAYRDLPITASHPETSTAIHDFAFELASHGRGAGDILRAAEADPESALANAYAAALFLTLMTREGQRRAANPLACALARYGDCHPREQQTIAAITAWHTGDAPKAVGLLRATVQSWPHDVVAAKLCQILEIGLGDGRGMLQTSGMAAAVDGRSGYALGLHAYALEQAGECGLAMRFARRAIEHNPGKDPWAEHVVAHVFAADDQPIEGRTFLHAHASGWDRCSSFMLTHNWWHLALFEIELGNGAAAFELLRNRVWGVRKEHAQDQINAISLLARLELAGMQAPSIWDDIAHHIEDRAGDRINDFLDLHYLYALAHAERDGKVRAMLERFDPQTPVGAIAHGIAAHAKGEYRLAASMIAPFRPHFHAIGGSNVQRDLFERIFIDSVVRCRDAGPPHVSVASAVQFPVAA